MNIEDLGMYFIKNNEVYYAIGYIDSPALELKNIITGQKAKQFSIFDCDDENE